jgi:hypothetical protein
MPLTLAIQAAQAADDAFNAAVKAAGYASRWDWDQANDSRPLAAYFAKVIADEAMHAAFVELQDAA